MFQVSFNATDASPLLPQIFAQYKANPSGFVEVFKEGVRCSDASAYAKNVRTSPRNLPPWG